MLWRLKPRYRVTCSVILVEAGAPANFEQDKVSGIFVCFWPSNIGQAQRRKTRLMGERCHRAYLRSLRGLRRQQEPPADGGGFLICGLGNTVTRGRPARQLPPNCRIRVGICFLASPRWRPDHAAKHQEQINPLRPRRAARCR